MSDVQATPGARLRAEREQRGLSVQKIADEMHLEAWVIAALEAGDYARIGPSVYAKGHMKTYASMLELPVAEMMVDFGPVQPAAPMRVASSIPVGSRHGAQQSRGVSPRQAAASLAAVLLVIALIGWQGWHHHTQPSASVLPGSADTGGRAALDLDALDSPGAPPAVMAPLTARDYAPRTLTAAGTGGGAVGNVGVKSAAGASAGAEVAFAGNAAGLGTVAGAGTVAGVGNVVGGAGTVASAGTVAGAGNVAGAGTVASAGNVAGAGNAAAAASSEPGAGRARLKLSFSSNSWVDVRDALGNRSYTGNGSANTVKTIAGNAPLHVYLRSANGVQLEINGRAVAIGSQFFSGDAARFEAGADGVLRHEVARPRTP